VDIHCNATTSRYKLLELLARLDEVSNRVLWNFLTFPVADKCHCACSAGGCTTLVMILKAFSQFISASPNSSYPRPKWCEIRLGLIEWLAAMVETKSDASAHVLGSILRFLIFQSLGLTHTCCFYNYGSRLIDMPLGDEEIAKIQKTERYTLRRLEILLMRLWGNGTIRLSRLLNS